MEATPHPPDELNAFIDASEAGSWSDLGGGEIRLVSGEWKGSEWEHRLVLVGGAPASNAAVLVLTGGDPNPLDLEEAGHIAMWSGLPVATLFHVPVQPIEERWEDDLIAHTFSQYLQTGDSSWPLLFPMARSAVRAMDALEALYGITRFIVTGASKRGWATWMAAATGDPRIVGISPVVFDNLNLGAQMRHQIESWGEYSEMIADYTARGLQESLATDVGRELGRIVDPYSYRARFTMPILIVNGGNDPYWTVDALSLYWNDLAEPKSCLILPNEGHVFVGKEPYLSTLGAFSRACTREFPWPEVRSSMVGDRWKIEAQGCLEISVWQADSPTLDFRQSEWKVIEMSEGSSISLGKPGPRQAQIAACLFETPSGAPFTLTTPVLRG